MARQRSSFMGALLFRHRLAVIGGFFLVAAVGVVGVARHENGGAGMALPSDTISGATGADALCWAFSAVACILAFAVRTWGEAHLGAAVYGQTASTTLVTSGPFGYVRHPLYVGTWLFFAGAIAPYLPFAATVVLAGLFAMALRAVAVHEEGALDTTHGEAWRRYCAHVPRLWGVAVAGWKSDGVVPQLSHWALAAFSNLGMLALGSFRLVRAAGIDFVGLRAATFGALVLWLTVVVVRRLRQR
jgi:protein-S-isoprenylcysteine O-methyltransferase Ste14